VTDGAGTVTVQALVVVRRDIAAGKILFNPFEELGVDGHQVFELAVNRAFLNHPNLAIALDNLRFDFADFLVDEIGPIFLAVNDQIARFADAIRTERVRGARPAESGLGLLPRLEQRLIRPLRSEGRIRFVLIEILNAVVRDGRRLAERPIERFPNLIANCLRHDSVPLLFVQPQTGKPAGERPGETPRG
jgi:hypothetical protein